MKTLPAIRSDTDKTPRLAAGAGASFEMLRAYFPKAQSLIRVASAYFTVSGYKIGREYAPEPVKFRFVVGKEDGKNVAKAVLDEIEDDLMKCDEDRWDAVQDLVTRMRSGEFKIVDARTMRPPFHPKLYIVDESVAWHGSPNFSKSGLKLNIEQAQAIKDEVDLRFFIEQFELWFSQADDLTAKLIQLLEDYLRLVSPFDIYLKVLFMLVNLPDRQVRGDAHSPVYFQKGVLARALRQIERYDGTIIVAATGLGKTVIGAEIAARLREDERIKRVLLLCPPNVQKKWRDELKGRDINFESFTYTIIFKQSGEIHTQIAELEQELERADADTLILIDEAHVYRNQILAELVGKDARVFKRIGAAIKNGAKIAMLTATPYSTSHQNLNSLLKILPNRAPDLYGEKGRWQVGGDKGAVRQFVNLAVCTVLGVPHVIRMARKRNDVDEQGRVYVQFGAERKYFPRMWLFRPRYRLPLEAEMQQAYGDGYFDSDSRVQHAYFDDDSGANLKRGQTDIIRKTVLDAWLSSPATLLETLEKNLLTTDSDSSAVGTDGSTDEAGEEAVSEEVKGYNVTFRISLAKRRETLTRLKAKVDAQGYDVDNKLQKLLTILDDRCCTTGGRTVIFVKRLTTAIYLEHAVQQLRPQLSVGCTVEKGDGTLKTLRDRLKLFNSFALLSPDEAEQVTYDVLICTDADKEGIDLPAADTLVSYDLPTSAAEMYQRTGRILRMTNNPNRIVHIYTLLPEVKTTTKMGEEISQAVDDILSLLNRVFKRHGAAKAILGVPVISDQTEGELVDLEDDPDLDVLTDQLGFSGVEASPEIARQDTLELYLDRAKRLRDNILSARLYDGKDDLVYVLVKIITDKGKTDYQHIVYNHSRRIIVSMEIGDVLDLIECEPNELTAIVPPNHVESLSNKAVQAWLADEPNLRLDNVSRICALYLKPKAKGENIASLFKDATSSK